MNIEYKEDDLLESKAEAFVNAVNCVGTMGKGIALQFKQAFPDNFKQYAEACKNNAVQPGKMNIYQTEGRKNPLFIINFPTRTDWKTQSKLEYLTEGLKDLVKIIKQFDIKSIAIPALGCGLGGLNWKVVEPFILDALKETPATKAYIYPPQQILMSQEMLNQIKRPSMKKTYALIIKLIEQYKLLGYLLRLIEVQKIAYLLQASGEDLKLNFVKHEYGPYAESLNHILQRMEGYYIRGYSYRGQGNEIKLTDDAVKYANKFLQPHKNAQQSLGKVKSLIEGFGTPYGVELLATVHWVATYENAKTLKEVIFQVYSWDERKSRLMHSKHIEMAYIRLLEQGWVTNFNH